MCFSLLVAMPILAAKAKTGREVDEKREARMSPEAELLFCCTAAKCVRRFERVLRDRCPIVNFKEDDGSTALHLACSVGSDAFVKLLLDNKADPNIPATSSLHTPLEIVLQKLEEHEDRESRFNSFETVNRSDGTSVAVKVDLNGWKRCKDLLLATGAVEGKCLESVPTVKPDGSVNGGPPSELRAYNVADDGSFSAAHHLRTGKYDVLKHEDGMLIRADFDPATGHWDVGHGMVCKDVQQSKQQKA